MLVTRVSIINDICHNLIFYPSFLYKKNIYFFIKFIYNYQTQLEINSIKKLSLELQGLIQVNQEK
jgi:hypothetical protein